MRADGLRDVDVDAALADGRILRTHILRPTWHFVLPADIRWMMQLTGPRVARVIRSAQDLVVPPEARIQHALETIRAELAGDKTVTRRELVAILWERGCVESQREIIPILIRAELDLVICSGGLAGKNQTYALVDERAPADPGWEFDRDWALGELTRRYFTGHGPASIADFTWWSGLTVADTKRGLEMDGPSLERLQVDGTDYWWAGDVGGGDGGDRRVPSPTVHLMQGYDEYIVAYRSPRDPINVSHLLSPTVLNRPPFLHGIVLDTQGVGWWRRVNAKSGFEIETKLARPFNRSEKAALGEAVERYAEFVAQPVKLMA
jgi:DNA glycosylase AlkZ-like